MAEAGPLSLRQRLWAWLMLPLLLVLVLGVALHRLLNAATRDWMDESLTDTALAVASLIKERDGALTADISQATELALRFDRQDRIYYVVITSQGQVLKGDEILAAVALPPSVPGAGEWQFADVRIAGQPARLARLNVACPGGGTCQVRAAETMVKRDEVQRQLWLVISLAMLCLASLQALAGWLAIRQGLRPLQALSAEVEARDLARLQPLGAAVPRELQPLIAAFNRLFERLRRAASAQQDFLADAAHQLRTPLTALRTEIDLALLEPHDPQFEPLLKRLQRAAGRSARLAQQMLSIARAEAPSAEVAQDLDLRDIATQVGEDWVPRALEDGVDLGYELQPAPARGMPHLLRELLENLVHNSVTHAGPGTQVTVRCGCDAAGAWLEVEDDGPGLPAAERGAALQRFRRGSTARGAGSGLGLAIAAEIAERHHGSITVGDPLVGSGLRVRLSLPPVAFTERARASNNRGDKGPNRPSS